MKKLQFLIYSLSIFLLVTISCSDGQRPRERVDEFATDSISPTAAMIPYDPQGNHEVVSVSFNGVAFNLLWDTGCSMTTIPVTDFIRMVNEDKITDYDFSGTAAAVIADGSTVESFVFNIATVSLPNLKGKPVTLHDVHIMVSPNPNASRLLGKNVIDQLGAYRRDEKESCIIIE